MNDIKVQDKPRKHRWITETIKKGETTLSLWPSPDEVENTAKGNKFLETIAKVGNDPRVINVERHDHEAYRVVFLFFIDPDA